MMWMFLAILVTFLITRTVTRLIRSGSGGGAGLGNVHIGGNHIHHQVFGILIIIGTGIVLVSQTPRGRRSTRPPPSSAWASASPSMSSRSGCTWRTSTGPGRAAIG